MVTGHVNGMGGGRGEGTRGARTFLGLVCHLVAFFVCIICKGDPYPEYSTAQAGGGGFPMSGGLHAGSAAGFLCLVYIPLWGERTVKRE
jgi:hypothetical protein